MKSKLDFTIRSAMQSDAARIAELSGQLGYLTSSEQSSERVAAVLRRDDHAVYVAEATATGILGWIHVHAVYLLETDPFVEIGGLVVDESWRGKGIGRLLIARAERWAQDRGYRYIRVRSNILREEAQKFYLQMTYQKSKVQNVFIKDLSQNNPSNESR